MKTTALLIFAMLITISLHGQNQLDITVKRERNFTGAGLYGFMNGGADLYLEYGVKELTTRDITYKGEDFTVDIYELPSGEDAFGIYSLHTFKCEQADVLSRLDCLSAYQLQLAVGNKYVSIVFPSGSAAAKQAAYELAKFYVDIEKSKELDIPSTLAMNPPYSGVLKFLRGPLSVSNAQSSLAKTIDGITYSGIWLIIDKINKENKALIKLTDNSDINKIKERIEASDIIETGDDFIFIKATTKTTSNKSESNPFGF